MSDPTRRTLEQGPPAARAVRLTVVEGAALGQEFAVEGPTTLGRSPDAQVMLNDAGVSRFHARLQRDSDGGGYLLEDLGSKNGTYLNGTRVGRAMVQVGDQIRIGPRVVLRLTSVDVLEEHLVQRERLETVGRLGAGIAHDLNNVLAALHAGTDFLEQLPGSVTLDDPRVRECLSDISLATARGSDLTRSILRIVRGRRSVRGPVDLSELALEVARILRHTIDHSIEVETAVTRGVTVHGNHSELQQVLLNLCLNARDAMPGGGRLGVKLALVSPPPELGLTERRCALLEVSDTGTGIDAATRARMFEPFFSTKREGTGFGIGLSTVRDLVTLHGGRISLDSTPGQGTTFRLYFPALDVRASAATGERAALPSPSQAGATARILLVDDEHLLRRSFGRLLRQRGFQVTEAAGGQDALSLYHPEQHDLVILDLDMPGMSGETTQVELLRRDPEARIMFASGHADPHRMEVVRERGAHAFLQKPYDLETLVDTIQQVMRATGFRDERTQIGEPQ